MTPERWLEITRVFHAALARQEPHRSSFLDEVCAGDAELRSQVDALLSADHDATSFPTRPAVMVTGSSSPSARTMFVAGELVAERFVIRRYIAGGGMGEVYEAEDLELREAVALKTIRPEIARDERALQRFRREVLLARRVTHPNVCRTFDIFRHRPEAAARAGGDDAVFVTMELLAGETLGQRLRRAGRMSTAAALPIVKQMASALAAAHAAGVVHRDFKSSNVMLLPPARDDQPPRVVITDFGLAHGGVDAEKSFDTGSAWVGTPAYMAPEQLEGGAVTPAVDIYALGVVMFEMVTGARPFDSDTPLSVVMRLYEPPPSPQARLSEPLDPRWEAAILCCLERRPDARFPTPLHVVDRLQDGSAATTRIGRSVLAGGKPGRLRWVILATVAAIASIAAVVWNTGDSFTPERLVRGRLALFASSDGRAYDPVLTPDGRMIVYVGEADEGRVDLFVGDVRGEGRVRLTSDDDREAHPKVSPDGSRVAFTRFRPDRVGPEVWTIPLLGGAATPVAAPAQSPDWSPDGTRLVFVHRPKPAEPVAIATARADGSDLKVLLSAGGPYLDVRAPAWSPDGQEVVFVRSRGGAATELWSIPAEGGEPRQLSDDSAAVFTEDPTFTPDGSAIVYSSNRGGATNIWMRPRHGGTPVRLTTGPGPDDTPSFARDGTMVFGSSRWRNTLVVYGPSAGEVRTLLTHPRYIWAPAFSPDGREIAYSQGEVDGSWHVWLVPADGSAPARRLASTAEGEVYPRFTPDGAFVVYHNWNEPRRIWRVPRGGGAPALLPFAQAPGDGYADISPDGRSIAFVRVEPDGECVYVAAMNGTSARRLVAGASTVPRWSPDGRWVAFSGSRSYATGIFIVRPDGTGLRRLTERGGWPVWWPDGQRIAYRVVGPDGNQFVESVAIEGGPPQRLDALRYNGANMPLDFSPSGALIATSNSVHISDEIWLLRPQP